MSNPGLSSQSERDQAKIQILAFFTSVCLAIALSLAFVCEYKLSPYKGPDLVLNNKINPNTDSAASLARLPNMGSVKANAIVEYRQNGNNYVRAEDLDNVKGIGPKTIENIRPYLEFGSK